MEFADLNDEIVADDWLIPNEEISHRQLIRQTPIYNIYKADWFGDVLVYEPVTERTIKASQLPRPPSSLWQDQYNFNQKELSLRLHKLNLNLSAPEEVLEGQLSPTSDYDSAYSSISSTPQHYTKNLESEFEFPINELKVAHKTRSCELRCTENNQISETLVKHNQDYKNELPPTLVLNKDSYLSQKQSSQDGDKSVVTTVSDCSSWQELNELRLIAHESFMLFMGASMEGPMNSESTSLVMQVNHPKTISLYNLLHTIKLSCTHVDRTSQQQLSYAAKSNICQQVTNAMTYLHDRNIVHGKLTSVNIYIELNQRVKISLIDNEETAVVSKTNDDSLKLNSSSLTYLSPELIKTMDKTGFKVDNLTKKSDVFAFGTLLYEIFEERFPFTNGNNKCSASELIYQIGSGQIIDKNLSDFSKHSALVEFIISACWSTDPRLRPHFKQLSFT